MMEPRAVFEERHLNNNKVSSNMGSVPDQKKKIPSVGYTVG